MLLALPMRLEVALFSVWIDKYPQEHNQRQTKYSAFLEEGWGLGKGETSFLVKRSFPLPQEHSSSSSIKRVKQLFYAFIQYRVDEVGSCFHHEFEDELSLVHTRVWDGEAWSVYHFVSEKDDIAVEGA